MSKLDLKQQQNDKNMIMNKIFMPFGIKRPESTSLG